MPKKALITGITGQDGSYLAELLLEKDYEVHGIIRRSSSFNTRRIDHIFDKLHLYYGDLTDGIALRSILSKVQPDEVYNLGAQSHVKVSFDEPVYSVDVDALGTIRLLESIRDVNPKIKYYQASSSEMFGGSPPPQNEKTVFYPKSPYGCAKVYSYHQVVNYREAYGLFACNGILFNHESPRRGETFVTRKITRAATRIAEGLQKDLYLGNLNARRDWGYAGDYVTAMWLMLQRERPDDFVISTGIAHTVSEFAELAFAYVGLDWQNYVKVDEKYLRPTEVDNLLGDSSKAKEVLNWKATTKFEDLVKMMVDSDRKLAVKEKILKNNGY